MAQKWQRDNRQQGGEGKGKEKGMLVRAKKNHFVSCWLQMHVAARIAVLVHLC